MFDNYIDQLAENLDEMDGPEVLEDYRQHKKSPEKGYVDYMDLCADAVFYTIEQQERYLEELWNEFDVNAVNQIYEDRLADFPGLEKSTEMKEHLSKELPIKQFFAEPKKVKI